MRTIFTSEDEDVAEKINRRYNQQAVSCDINMEIALYLQEGAQTIDQRKSGAARCVEHANRLLTLLSYLDDSLRAARGLHDDPMGPAMRHVSDLLYNVTGRVRYYREAHLETMRQRGEK